MAAKKRTAKTRAVVITTEHRGVFFGTMTAHDIDARRATLKGAVMAIHWNTTGGLFELASAGPNAGSRLSVVAPSMEVEKITAIMDVTEAAETAWAQYAK